MAEKKPEINVGKIVKNWIETSDEDFDTMLDLYASKKYNWSLFLGHISTEKILKALYVKQFGKHAPLTHNLFRLAELNNLEVNNEYADWLDEITTFNINARYEDYKREFHLTCTPEFTNEWINKIRILRKWIKEML